eukprot:4967893-Prymnesium_polylepis.1
MRRQAVGRGGTARMRHRALWRVAPRGMLHHAVAFNHPSGADAGDGLRPRCGGRSREHHLDEVEAVGAEHKPAAKQQRACRTWEQGGEPSESKIRHGNRAAAVRE